MSFEVNPEYLEQCMTKHMLEDKSYLVTLTSVFDKEYFGTDIAQKIFSISSDYFKEHKDIPDRGIILSALDEKSKKEAQEYFNEIDSVDVDLVKHYDWLMNETDKHLRDKAIKKAVMDSVDIIEEKGDINSIRKMVEDALCKRLNIDLGLNYFDELGTRLHRMFTDDTQRLATGFPVFDEYINGGFPPKTLSVFVAKIHGFKSNVMANMIARQVMQGKNIFLASLEMSEDMFAQRFDGIYSGLDINRFYFNKKLQKELMKTLKDVKSKDGRGNLFVKSFPTGKASVADFRIWVRELTMRGFAPDAFYFDYLNLMKPEYASKDSLYSDVKAIAEESRAMGFEFDIPMISVSQLNRAGTFMNFEEVDFNSISESLGVPATADFMMIMGANDEHMVYKNEVHYKIVKNRLGGRVGEIDKFYYDGRSLKMYDSSELDVWMDDVRVSGDERVLMEG